MPRDLALLSNVFPFSRFLGAGRNRRFGEGLPTAWGRPDPQNRRFPVGQQKPEKGKQCRRAAMSQFGGYTLFSRANAQPGLAGAALGACEQQLRQKWLLTKSPATSDDKLQIDHVEKSRSNRGL